MIVVADTSPINYLVLIGRADILGRIYERVVVPKAVFAELSFRGSPPVVRSWVEHPPQWLETSDHSSPEDDSLSYLDRGERDAIALAQHLGAERLIVDDAAARREAEARGIPVIGMLGVLAEAARRDLLSLPEAVHSLRATSFYVSEDLLQRLMALDRERRR